MLDKLKSYLESIHITPVSWLFGVSGVFMVRFFLESLSSPTSSGFFSSDASTLMHYYLFLMTAVMIFMIFIRVATPSWKSAAPQFAAVVFLALFIGPIIDWIVSGAKGFRMLYLFESPKDLLMSFFSFTNAGLNSGATIGLQIELGLLIVCSGLFVYFVGRSWKRAVISALVLYVIIFVLSALPSFISFIGGGSDTAQNYFGQPLFFIQKTIENSATISNNLHSSLQYSSVTRAFEVAFNFLMGKILFLILATLTIVWFRLNLKEKFNAMMGNFRSGRAIHFILMVFLGLLVAHISFPAVVFNWNDILSVVILCLAVYFSGMFAVCVNDIVDEDIDAISNTGRPLITKTLSKEDMKQAGTIFLVASLIAAYLAGYTAFFFVLVFTALYYIYSAPPTRFKLIPLFSSFIIGLCSLVVVMAGFFLLSPLKQVSAFPSSLILAVVVFFSLLTGIRDIKDIEGDRAAGIKTVPIIFGDIWGLRVVGLMTVLGYVLLPIFLKINLLFITAIPSALLTYYFVNKKPYKEARIFQIYFFFLLMSFLFLFL